MSIYLEVCRMIIGLSGKASSGKDTTADILVRIYGFQKTALANPMKKVCMDVYGFTHTQLWGPSEHRNAPDMRYPRKDGTYLTPREALQRLGSEWARNNYEDTWVDLVMRQADQMLQADSPLYPTPPKGVIITDIRFPNEFDALKKRGAKVVRIKRPGAGLKGEAANHSSEIALDQHLNSEFDYVLDNSGTMEQLEDNVVEMMKVLRGY